MWFGAISAMVSVLPSGIDVRKLCTAFTQRDKSGRAVIRDFDLIFNNGNGKTESEKYDIKMCMSSWPQAFKYNIVKSWGIRYPAGINDGIFWLYYCSRASNISSKTYCITQSLIYNLSSHITINHSDHYWVHQCLAWDSTGHSCWSSFPQCLLMTNVLCLCARRT